MVYLLHFEPKFQRIRHYCGSTPDYYFISELRRNTVPATLAPIVQAAQDAGVVVTVARTWSSVYSRVDELPYPNDRGKLCPICLEANRARRRQ